MQPVKIMEKQCDMFLQPCRVDRPRGNIERKLEFIKL
jgi:hypothetical protein